MTCERGSFEDALRGCKPAILDEMDEPDYSGPRTTLHSSFWNGINTRVAPKAALLHLPLHLLI